MVHRVEGNVPISLVCRSSVLYEDTCAVQLIPVDAEQLVLNWEVEQMEALD